MHGTIFLKKIQSFSWFSFKVSGFEPFNAGVFWDAQGLSNELPFGRHLGL